MSVDLSKAAAVANAFQEATAANLHTPARCGNVVVLTPENADDVLITADLHGQRQNFERLQEIAALDDHPRRHLVLQEVCHGGPCYEHGGCMSHMLLEEVARLKAHYPERVHFLLSNHELSELTDYPILKARRMLNLAFRMGLQEAYGCEADQVRQAMLPFLRSCPVAVRAGGVFICHSLPEGVDSRGFDTTIFDRPLVETDLMARGPVFNLVWGRDFRPENAAAFAQLVGADVLIHGHEPCPDGFRLPNDTQLILDSCCARAAYLLLPVGPALSHSEIAKRVAFVS